MKAAQIPAEMKKEAWRMAPHSFAKKASGGKWKSYPHLRHASRIITLAIAKGGGRIVFTMPPRHGKSEFVSHWLPVWFFDLWPEKRIILTSYGDSLARFFGRKVRNELEGNRFVSTRLPKDKTAAGNFETHEGGGLITAGIGGPITGRGGDIVIIDDPIKTQEEALSETIRQKHIEWFQSTLYTRLEPGATIIVLMTRWHEGDLAGWLLDNHEDDWQEIRLPAIAEANDPLGRAEGQALCAERYDEEALKKIQKAVGSRAWNALYQGRPAPIEGEVWKRTHWRRYTKIPDQIDEWIQSWDLTFKKESSSWVVGQVWAKAGANKYLAFQVRGKWGFNESLDKIRMVTGMFPQAMRKLIEAKANGSAVEDTLQKEIPGIILVEPHGGKLARALAVEPEIESGNVYLPADELGYDWPDGFIEEAAAFPNGADDDQVDCASQALKHFDSGTIAFGTKKSQPRRRGRIM